MITMKLPRLLASVVTFLAFASFAFAEAPDPAEGGAKNRPLSHYYGFLPPEIYKLNFRIKNLLLADVNQDGLLDVVVVNNLANRIDVLEQRKDPSEAPAAETGTDDINEIPSDARMKHRKIQTPRNVASLAVRDVNNDKRPDLVYLGDPPGLHVEYQKEDGTFGNRRSFELADAQQNVWMLDVGDLNGDGRDDIAFLGKQNLYIVIQKENGTLEEPKSYRLSEEGASLIRVIDLDEDGANDVVYISDDSQFPVRIRFQSKDNRLGAERRLGIDSPRGVAYANVDGKPGQEMLIISNLSERLIVYGLSQPSSENGEFNNQFVIYPFEKGGGSLGNDMVIADFDQDGRSDIVVSDPASARLVLYLQREGSGLDLGYPYPAMLGTTLLRTCDADGDGKKEILALSTSENAIGMSRFDGHRLTFPEALPIKDEPLAIEVIGEGPGTRLFYVARVRDESTRKDNYFLRALAPNVAEGKIAWEQTKLADAEQVDLGFKGKPTEMRAIDANADGRSDLIFFFLSQPPVLWLGGEDGSFAEASKASQGTLGNVNASATYFGKLGDQGNAFLVAQNNFARRLLFDANSRWQVLDQYNATEASAKVTGITALDLDNDGKPELAMYDRTSRSLLFLKERNGVFERWNQLKVGAFDLRGISVADFDGNGQPDIVLFDGDKMGIAYTGKKEFVMRQIANYETDIRKGQLFDMVAGDLNNNGRMDILLLEPIQHNLEIVTFDKNEQLKRALRFKVFEEKTFRADGGTAEPREAVIGDVNNDGRDDIVLIVHDRVLIYLQDPGPAAEPSSPTAGK